MKILETRDKIAVLREEMEVIKSRIEEHGTGHLHTAIGVIERRVEELEQEFLEEQQKRNR